MDSNEATKTAAGKLWTNFHSGLTAVLAVAVVIVVIIGYAIISKVVEAIVGAAAGAAAGLGVSHLLWNEEERSAPAATLVIAVVGSIAGTAAAMIRSLVAAYSVTGSAIVGALAGAAIVALAKGLLQWLIGFVKWLMEYWNELKIMGIAAMCLAALERLKEFANWVKNKIKPLMDKIKGIADKVKKAVQEIADTVNNLLAPFGGAGAIGGALAAALGSIGLASALGLLGTVGAMSILVGGTGILYGLHLRGELKTQANKVASLVNYVGVLEFWIVVLLLFLLLSLLQCFRCEQDCSC